MPSACPKWPRTRWQIWREWRPATQYRCAVLTVWLNLCRSMCRTGWIVPSSRGSSVTAGSPTWTSPTRCRCRRRRACGGAGRGLTVFIGLRVEGHSRETSSLIEQALLAIPAVVACYVVSGTDDFLVEAAVPDLVGYEQVLLDQILAI